MDEKVSQLLKLYYELNEDNKKYFLSKVLDYEKKDSAEKKSIKEAFNKSLGPLMSVKCIYCGK